MRTYIHSSVGTRHQSYGVENQDACLVFDEAGASAGVLADGMGSCSGAKEAANAAAQEGTIMSRFLLSKGSQQGIPFAEGIMMTAFDAALRGVRSLAETRGHSIHHYGTTFVSFALDGETGELVWGSVGDSGLLALMEDGTVRVVTEYQKGPEGRAQTYALDRSDQWRFGRLSHVAAVIGATDGILDRLFVPVLRGAPLPTRLAVALFDLVCSCSDAEGGQLLDQVLENKTLLKGEGPFAGVTDDKTLVISAREEACRLLAGKIRVADGEER